MSTGPEDPPEAPAGTIDVSPLEGPGLNPGPINAGPWPRLAIRFERPRRQTFTGRRLRSRGIYPNGMGPSPLYSNFLAAERAMAEALARHADLMLARAIGLAPARSNPRRREGRI